MEKVKQHGGSVRAEMGHACMCVLQHVGVQQHCRSAVANAAKANMYARLEVSFHGAESMPYPYAAEFRTRARSRARGLRSTWTS